MKSNFKLCNLLALSGTVMLLASKANADTLYWDNNTTTSGFGTAGGTWSSAGSALWNQDPVGGTANGGFKAAGYVTTSSDAAHFGTSTNGLVGGTVAVSGTVNVGSLTIGSASGAITFGSSASTISIASGGTISNNSISNSVISSALGGSGGFIVNSGGAGSIQFGTAISHLGSMRIDNGTVLMGNNGVTGNLTKIILNGSGANMRLSGGTFTFDEVFEVTENGGTITRGSNSGTLTGSFAATGTGNRTMTLRHDDATAGRSLTLSGSFVLADPSSGRLSMNKTGVGTLNLGLANTFTGSTTITAGTLNLTDSSALQNSYIDTTNSVTGDGTNGLVNSGATLNLGGLLGSKDVSTLFKTGGGYGSLTALTLNVASGNDLSYSGSIGNGGGGLALTKTGTGTQVLTSVSNSYQGGTTVSNGTLGFASGALGNTGNITVNGGTLRWESGNTQNVSARIVMEDSGSATFNTNGNNVTFTAGIGSSSTSSLTKSGNGTLTLSGTNNYTGTTTVSAGVLSVNGSLANTTTTVGSTGTLQGSGTIGGSVTIQSGGTLAPGNSIESLGTGALSFLTGSTYDYELQTNLYASTPNGAGDLTYTTSTLDIASGAILTLTDLATSTALATGSKLTLISYGSGWTSTELFTYLGNTLNDDSTFTLGANQWLFNYNDTVEGLNFAADSPNSQSYVTMTVVIPEPRAVLLGGLGMLMLLRRRRD